MKIEAPVAQIIPETLQIHGDIRIDNYYWLNDRENPEVIAYLNAENEYIKHSMKHTEKLQEKLFNELKNRLIPNDVSAPYFSNGYYYYSRYEKDLEYPLYCRKPKDIDQEELLLNVNLLAKDYEFYEAGNLQVSPDNKILAFAEDTLSRRIYDIRFLDLVSGKFLPKTIKATTGNIVWANDNRTLYYSVQDPVTLRSDKIFRHSIQAPDTAADELVYEEKDSTFFTYVSKSRSGKYIMISNHATLSSEILLGDAEASNAVFTPFQKREPNHEYAIDHQEGRFLILSNKDAVNFKLMECPEQNTSRANWKEVFPERKDVLLEEVNAFQGYFVMSERIDGIVKFRIVFNDQSEHYAEFKENAYSAYMGRNKEYNSDIIRLNYSSLTTPDTDYDYHVREKSLQVIKEKRIPGGFDAENYHSIRINALAQDGEMIPITMVYRKDKVAKGSVAPLLLYAYGSYGISMDPYFSSDRLSLLDRGFIYAIAHIRGGQEKGRRWYDDGKLLRKMNTFTDYIDCAEFLIESGYTDKDHLFAMGGSAGGLLMGAVVNLRPDLFKGVIAAVPFVDVLTTMLDESIPLTTGEYDEWGNPNDPEYYGYMKQYSPYDNVEPKAYPAMLVTTGLHDSQVQYWEPAKWVAKLRTVKTDNNPLYLFTQMEAGHGGASGRYKRYHELAMEYAFFLDLAGIME